MITNRKNQGFTLIEVIVTFVVAAIMAAMVYTYFGSALTQSSVPISRLQQASNLHQVMENIVTDYNRLNKINLRYKWRSSHPYKVGDIVLPSNHASLNPSDGMYNIKSIIDNNARYYICTTAGTSGTAMVPASWPVTPNPGLTTGGTVNDGGTVWREYGYVWKEGTTYPANSIIVPKINNGHFYRGGGTSGSKDPYVHPPDPGDPDTWWTITEGGTENDNLVTWTEVGTILESSDAAIENLWTLLPINTTPTRYGTGYTVYEKEFIGLDEGTSQETTTFTEKNLLKVTIKNNSSNETLTQIFTIR